MSKPTRLDYCQYLLSTPSTIRSLISQTILQHVRVISRAINSAPGTFGKPSSHTWCKPRRDTPLCTASVAKKIALAKKQYSGNGDDKWHRYCPCVYVNPVLDRFWLIDYGCPSQRWLDQFKTCSRS